MRRTSFLERTSGCHAELEQIASLRLQGRVTAVSGLVVEVDGLAGHLSIGDRLLLTTRGQEQVPAEVVGLSGGRAQAMPFAALDGVGPGSTAIVEPMRGSRLAVSDGWLGRVLDPLGRPLDGRGALPRGQQYVVLFLQHLERLRLPPRPPTSGPPFWTSSGYRPQGA